VSIPVYNWEQAEHFPLMVSLQRVAASAGRGPREDQLTTLLAWLCALSETVTSEVVGLLLAGDDEALNAASGKARVATQVPLPGGLIADLSFAWPARTLQLLVEVKFDAPFGLYTDAEGTIATQPDEYVRVWGNADVSQEARVRRVGTLSGEWLPEATAALGPVRRARDIRWLDLRNRLSALLESDRIEIDARAAARELEEYLTLAFEPPSDAALKDAKQVMVDFAQRLRAELFPGSQLGEPKITSDTTFCVQGNVWPVRVGDQDLSLWLAFTAARSRYSPLAWPDALQLAFHNGGNPFAQAAIDRLRAAGFHQYRDGGSWGPRPFRVWMPWADLRVDDPAGHAVKWARDQLAELVAEALPGL